MDVEGAEYALLEGASKTLAGHRLVLYCEASSDELQRAGRTLDMLYDLLLRNDYVVWAFKSNRVTTVPLSVKRQLVSGFWAAIPRGIPAPKEWALR